jgi:twitching motility protein PilT
VEELGLPPVIGELADEERGIILVTGTTGSGSRRRSRR